MFGAEAHRAGGVDADAGFGVPAFPLPLTLISNILIWICAALTIYSGAEYLIQNREVFTGSM